MHKFTPIKERKVSESCRNDSNTETVNPTGDDNRKLVGNSCVNKIKTTTVVSPCKCSLLLLSAGPGGHPFTKPEIGTNVRLNIFQGYSNLGSDFPMTSINSCTTRLNRSWLSLYPDRICLIFLPICFLY